MMQRVNSRTGKMISDIYSQDTYEKPYHNKSEQNGKVTEKRSTKLFRSEHFINLITRAVGRWLS